MSLRPSKRRGGGQPLGGNGDKIEKEGGSFPPLAYKYSGYAPVKEVSLAEVLPTEKRLATAALAAVRAVATEKGSVGGGWREK